MGVIKGAAIAALLFLGPELILAGAQQKSGEITYKCEAAGIQLQGKVVEHIFYGPPGFGDTPAQDAREKAFILLLDKAITVQPQSDAEARDSTCLTGFHHVRRVQLEFLHMLATGVGKLSGSMVTVSGTLDEAAAPSEHTDVTMDVESIKPLL